MYKARQPLGTDVLKDVSDWAYDQFKEVEQGFQDLDSLRLATLNVEPVKKRDGDIAFADGTDWDPGSGQGTYIYYGGAWHKMQNTAVGTIIGSTGAVDNRLLRSDGTGGSTIQASAITVDDSGNVSGTGTIDVGNADTTLSRLGAGDVAVEGNRLYHAGGTDVPVADGGTGASDAATARTNLGVGIALLASGSNTNQATLDLVLSSFTGYFGFIVKLVVRPTTDGVDLWCRFSTDGGANYITSGYDFVAQLANDGGTSGVNGNGSDSKIIMNSSSASTQIGNGATEGWFGNVELLNPGSAAFWSRITFAGYYISNAATPAGTYTNGGGAQETAQDTDAIRFMMSSGNLDYSYRLYGLL